jgi:type IV secretory pathway VirJ component
MNRPDIELVLPRCESRAIGALGSVGDPQQHLGSCAERVLARLALCMLLLLPGSCADSGAPSELISSGRFHDVHVYRPQRGASRLVLFLSGDGGWSSGLGSIAVRLSESGALVAGMDARDLLDGSERASTGCLSAAAELDSLARELQRRYHLPDVAPVLIGHSAGATLAYVALAQSQAGTFAGAVTLSFCDDLDLAAPLCPALPATARSPGVRLLPGAPLPRPWVALHGLDDEECPAGAARAFVAATPGAQFVGLPGVGHTYRRTDRWWRQFAAGYQRVLAGQARLPPR